MYRNITKHDACISLLQQLSNVEHLTLVLAIDKRDTTQNYSIDRLYLETNIVIYMPYLRQFHYHIRLVLNNVSHLTFNENFLQQEQSFGDTIDYFRNNYVQYQMYSLPFVGNRLDFVSNRFPLFNNKTFSNVTILTLFDDVKPFENSFFENVARTLPRLRTLEIINLLEQQENTITTKTNIIFTHLTVLILYDVHMDYMKQFLYEFHLPSLIELAFDKHLLFTVFAQNQQRTSDICSRIRIIHTSKPSYQSIHTIQSYFPHAHYIKHVKDKNI